MDNSARLEGDQPNVGNQAGNEGFLAWKQAEAIRWLGHEFDEDGFHDE